MKNGLITLYLYDTDCIYPLTGSNRSKPVRESLDWPMIPINEMNMSECKLGPEVYQMYLILLKT